MAKKVAIGIIVLLVATAVIVRLGTGGTDTADVAEIPAPSSAQPAAPSASPPVPSQDSSAQLSYLDHLVSLSHQLADATMELSKLFEDARNDPALLHQQAWNSQLRANLDVLQSAYNQSQTMTPPEDMGIIHGKTVESFGHANLAADYFARGIDTRDPTLFEQGNNELHQTSTNMNELAALVEEYRAAHGL